MMVSEVIRDFSAIQIHDYFTLIYVTNWEQRLPDTFCPQHDLSTRNHSALVSNALRCVNSHL